MPKSGNFNPAKSGNFSPALTILPNESHSTLFFYGQYGKSDGKKSYYVKDSAPTTLKEFKIDNTQYLAQSANWITDKKIMLSSGFSYDGSGLFLSGDFFFHDFETDTTEMYSMSGASLFNEGVQIGTVTSVGGIAFCNGTLFATVEISGGKDYLATSFDMGKSFNVANIISNNYDEVFSCFKAWKWQNFIFIYVGQADLYLSKDNGVSFENIFLRPEEYPLARGYMPPSIVISDKDECTFLNVPFCAAYNWGIRRYCFPNPGVMNVTDYKSDTTSGYLRFGNGILIQWGWYYTSTALSSITYNGTIFANSVRFPISFVDIPVMTCSCKSTSNKEMSYSEWLYPSSPICYTRNRGKSYDFDTPWIAIGRWK